MVWIEWLDIAVLREHWTGLSAFIGYRQGERRDDSDVGYIHVQGCEPDMYCITQLDVIYFTRQEEIPRSMEGTGE